MVTIGTGPDDPRAWVRAAYLILDAAEAASPDDKLPSHVQIAATLGISRFSVGHACRELARLGLVRLVPGHGYYSGDALGGTAEPAATTRELLAGAAAVHDILAADRISAGDYHTLDDLRAVLEQRQCQADTDA